MTFPPGTLSSDDDGEITEEMLWFRLGADDSTWRMDLGVQMADAEGLTVDDAMRMLGLRGST